MVNGVGRASDGEGVLSGQEEHFVHGVITTFDRDKQRYHGS